MKIEASGIACRLLKYFRYCARYGAHHSHAEHLDGVTARNQDTPYIKWWPRQHRQLALAAHRAPSTGSQDPGRGRFVRPCVGNHCARHGSATNTPSRATNGLAGGQGPMAKIHTYPQIHHVLYLCVDTMAPCVECARPCPHPLARSRTHAHKSPWVVNV